MVQYSRVPNPNIVEKKTRRRCSKLIPTFFADLDQPFHQYELIRKKHFPSRVPQVPVKMLGLHIPDHEYLEG